MDVTYLDINEMPTARRGDKCRVMSLASDGQWFVAGDAAYQWGVDEMYHLYYDTSGVFRSHEP